MLGVQYTGEVLSDLGLSQIVAFSLLLLSTYLTSEIHSPTPPISVLLSQILETETSTAVRRNLPHPSHQKLKWGFTHLRGWVKYLWVKVHEVKIHPCFSYHKMEGLLKCQICCKHHPAYIISQGNVKINKYKTLQSLHRVSLSGTAKLLISASLKKIMRSP